MLKPVLHVPALFGQVIVTAVLNITGVHMQHAYRG